MGTLTYPGAVLANPRGFPLPVVEQTYETPVGYWDFPFIYSFDASKLTNGQNYTALAVEMDGTADFILRGVFGFSHVLAAASASPPGRFRLYNAWGRYCSSAPMIVNPIGVIAPLYTVSTGGGGTFKGASLANPDQWQILPERRYPYNGQIQFDLLNVLLGNSVVSNPSVFRLGFIGVKRRPWSNVCLYETPYRYKELPFSYAQSLTLNPGVDANGNLLPPITLYIPVQNYDFELQSVIITVTSAGSSYPSTVLYDASGEPTSSGPVYSPYTTDFSLTYGGNPVNVFPCPPLVYPNQSVIRLDCYSSILAGNGSSSFSVEFRGVQRLPC